MTTDSPPEITLVYDGECPLCRRYARLARIRASAGALRLHDARQGGAIVAEISARGMRLDEGAVLVIGREFLHGADSLHALALLGTRSDVFNRTMRWIFRSPTRARLLYPLLRAGRNLLLKLRGKPTLEAQEHEEQEDSSARR